LIREGVKNVGLEHRVIELEMIPADDQVGAHELLAKAIHFIFRVNFVAAAGGAVGDAHRDPHFGFMREAPDVAEAALGFQIEIDDVFDGHAGA